MLEIFMVVRLSEKEHKSSPLVCDFFVLNEFPKSEEIVRTCFYWEELLHFRIRKFS